MLFSGFLNHVGPIVERKEEGLDQETEREREGQDGYPAYARARGTMPGANGALQAIAER